MFCKSLIVFGLLAAFSVQGMETIQLDARTVELRELSDLVDQAKNHIADLNDILSGFRKSLEGFFAPIKAIKEKFLNRGLTGISDAFEKGMDFMASKIEEAANLGINIVQCTTGKHELLVDYALGPSGELIGCVSEPVSAAISEFNIYLENSDEIVKNVAILSAKLDECLKSLEPIVCVTDLNLDMTKFERELHTQVSDVMEKVSITVASLPVTLGRCSDGSIGTANSKVDEVIDEVIKCVDELKPELTFRF